MKNTKIYDIYNGEITTKVYIHDCKMKTNWNFANLVLGGLVNCNNKKHENHHQTLIIRLLN